MTDAADVVARARRDGSVDLGGLRLDLDPAAETLLVACTGFVPTGEVIYAHEYTRLEHRVSRLLVCDPGNRWYLGGVPGVTGSIYATIALMGEVIGQIRPALSIAVGTSMGGYLSLLLGCAGLVDEAVGFAPQTTLDPAWRAAHADHRWAPDIDAGLAALAPLPPPDVVPWAEAPGPGGARLHVFYPDAEAADVAHARRLAGLVGALLYPVDTCHHTVSNFLRRKGVLARVIAEIIDGGAPLALVGALHDDADDPERAYRDGSVLLERADLVAAERSFRHAVAAEDPLNHYFGGLAEAIWRQGRAEEAMRVVRDAVALRPDDAYRRLTLGLQADRQGLDAEAEASLRTALAMAPGEAKFAEETCALLVRRGRMGEAVALAWESLDKVRGPERFGAAMAGLLGPAWRGD